MSRGTRSQEYRRYAFEREAQKMLGVVTSVLETVANAAPYVIRSISSPNAKTFSLVAERELNAGNNVNTLLVDVVPSVANSEAGDIVQSHLEKRFDEPEKNTTVDRVLVISSAIKQHIQKVISSSLHNSVVWAIDPERGSISIAHGNHFDKQLNQILKNSYTKLYDNFPNPYFPGMNPLLKVHFLTLNFNRKGFHAFSDIVEDAVRLATTFGPYRDRAPIFSDMSNLLNALMRIGIAKGSARVSFPWVRSRIEMAFLKRYPVYLLKSSRTSLYDFDSLL